jgi:hypothetical protein
LNRIPSTAISITATNKVLFDYNARQVVPDPHGLRHLAIAVGREDDSTPFNGHVIGTNRQGRLIAVETGRKV